MSLASPKFLKSLIAVLCLSMILWSSVSAQSLILCVNDKGHAEIESALDSCCIKQPLNTNEVSMKALDLNACGNCTDTPLSFYFHQSSSRYDLRVPLIGSQMDSALFPSNDPIDFTYDDETSSNYPIAGLVFHSHLDIQKITVLRV